MKLIMCKSCGGFINSKDYIKKNGEIANDNWCYGFKECGVAK